MFILREADAGLADERDRHYAKKKGQRRDSNFSAGCVISH
jgi:hypothetical protein